MKAATKRFLSLAIVMVMLISLFSGCAANQNHTEGITDENGNTFIGMDASDLVQTPEGDDYYASLSNGAPTGQYNEGTVLIKNEAAPDADVLTQNGILSAEPLYVGSAWYIATLADSEKTEETVAALRELDCFDAVDFDYIMDVGAYVESVDVSCNPDHHKHHHHHTHKVPEGWEYINEHDKNPGGSADVVVAVIDTGVDYNHLDLRNNIWVNSGEIPGNGIDDDGNGYIDDINGWNCVGDNNNPMDDNGHGTHVAGIIAAENNDIGGVGIAYNCKIMPIKAGNSSGYFNNSDIAEAIQYAYMNGASVINMSFGGSMISIAVEDALQNAYTSCILVAAAGNDSACNNLECTSCDVMAVNYPAALPYVIGVMSVNSDGSTVSGFSNYDHKPYDSVEYEVYAVGETVPSTWPGNKYATLQGTSMAAPSVSAIAALLRSYYTDREMYSTKFIQSQIVNTGTVNPYNAILEDTDGAHSVTNAYEALTRLPKPNVNLYDYWIDDSAAVSDTNNGNGVIDAGETVRLYVSLHNRGGVASNVKVTADVIRGENVVDPYFTFVNSEIHISDIGTYSVRESGDKYFEIIVSSDCPNDYLTTFNICYTYENGMDAEDTTLYTDDGKQQAQFVVSNGVVLTGQITEDTILTKDNYYIIPSSLYIPEGVTVTVEAGTKIQFWTGDAQDEYAETGIAMLTVAGRFITQGTVGEPVEIFPSEYMGSYQVEINTSENGDVELNYTTVTNSYLSVTKVDHCTFRQNYEGALRYKKLNSGRLETYTHPAYLFCWTTVTNSVFYRLSNGAELCANCNACVFANSQIEISSNWNYTNCVFVGNVYHYNDGRIYPSTLDMKTIKATVSSVFRNEETGTSYMLINVPGVELDKTTYSFYDDLAKSLGGHIAMLESIEEIEYIISYSPYPHCFSVDLPNGSTAWPDGSPLEGITIEDGKCEYPTYYCTSQKLNYGYAYDYVLIEIPGSIYLDSLTLKESAVAIDDQTSYQIQVGSVLPVTFDTDTLVYVSGDTSVATVSENGLVTPLRAGEVDIYVYSPDYVVMAVCHVTVAETIPATSVSLGDGCLAVGSSMTLSPVITPANTTEKPGYTSSDPAIASVENGVVTAHKPGTVTITVTVGSVSATCQLQVVRPVQSIHFADNFYLTYVGDTAGDWKPVITPADATDVVITYLSSNPEIAYVDENGDLIRVAPGNATIRATVADTELYAEVTVNVSAEPVDNTVEVVQMTEKAYNSYRYAVLSDNTLWAWGGKYTVPVKLRDDVISADWVRCTRFNDGCLIVNSAGELRYFGLVSYLDTTYDFSIHQDTDTVLMNNVKKISYGVAVCNDGTVYNISYSTSTGDYYNPVATIQQISVSGVIDVYGVYSGAYLLKDNGELLYFNGDCASVPEKLLDGVTEISGCSNCLVAYTNTGIYKLVGTTITNVNVGEFVGISYIYQGSTYASHYYYDKDYYISADQLAASKVFTFDRQVFIQTTDGKFYGIGYNGNSQIGAGTNTEWPGLSRIFFGLSGSDLTPVVDHANIQDEVLNEQKIVLDFNAGVCASANYESITLTTPQGIQCSILKNLVLDQCVIAPVVSLTYGETYTLTVPAGALATHFGVANEEIVYTFTYLDNTTIQLVSGTLSDGAVLTDTEFSASFHYTMANQGAQFGEIAILQGEEAVSGITVSLTGNALTLSGTLDYGEYSLHIPAGALADNVGGTNEELLLSFTIYKPTEYTCTVAEGVTRVDERQPITVTFTNAMQAVDLTGITLTDTDGNAVALEVTLEEMVLTIAHGGLAQGTLYTLYIPAGAVTDRSEKGNVPITVHFDTYFPVALEHISVFDGATQFALDGAVKLYYNDSCYTLDASKLALTGPEGLVTFTLAQEGEVVTLKPTAPLAANAAYTLTVAEGAMTDERGALSAAFVTTLQTVEQTERFFWTVDFAQAIFDQMKAEGFGTFRGNAILNALCDTNVEHWMRIIAPGGSASTTIGVAGNYWGTTDLTMIERQIVDFDDYQTLCDIIVGDYLLEAPKNTFPFVTDAYILNADGERVDTISYETVTFVLEFNRDMDITQELSLRFGSVEPYADYRVTGSFVTPRRWEGTYTFKGTIEGGVQHLNISDGCAADDAYLELFDSIGRFAFTIDTTAALSMSLFAEPKENGIELTWLQDDYDTLMGYNIYRSEEKDGNFVKLNPAILLSTDESFLDTNAEPGKTYWYTFTVVLSDFTESAPAGKVMATAVDTEFPNMYHTPVNQGYMNNNLVISCTASDNVGIVSATLYYRTVGDSAWKSLAMSKVNDKYSATVFGSELSMAGLEYYIEATDGRNTIAKGSAETPYTVIIKDASAISHLGDVDGDGTITTKDALMIMQAINGDLLLSDDEFKRANLNGDTVLSSVEALRILQYINGNVTTLEM